jgi:Rrf2 family iron-sulfur cluster assembly transcriptional regulator
MLMFLNGVSLRHLVDEQRAKGFTLEEGAPLKRAMSPNPVLRPIRVTGPNSVFALGNVLSK